MPILRMADLDLSGKRVLIREDLNVPVKDGHITSEQRILAALPTLRLALEKGAAVMVTPALLRAHPDARVLVGREEWAVRARETDGAERDRLWSLAAGAYPGYELYAAWTHRLIPVIALDPVEA